MSCDIDSDSFHGTKKGGVRRTAVRAFRTKQRISRSLMFLRRELDRLYKDGKVPMEDYNILRTCLSHYKEYMPVDKRFKI
tara:strand:+ start:1167 stop:1406 length:240 start_codon:yes stop_codon:yes gene_type:complete